MAFLNPFLLSALGLVAIPVILHLLLRPKPKQLIFPALRLIRERRKRNVRRFRLRHWWLLFLRMAAIGLIVFGLTRPTLPAANYALTRGELLTLVTVTCAGIATYFLILNRWQRRTLPRHELEYRRSSLRAWTTVAVLLAIAFAVGWPYQRRVRAEIKSPPTTRQLDIPVAAVFLFDTSMSMDCKLEGSTRLQEAQRLALAHLSELPAGSRVAVGDSSDMPFAFHPSRNEAQKRIEELELNAVAIPLSDRIRGALLEQRADRERIAAEFGEPEPEEDEPLTAGRDRYVRRIYIFTDLARSAWSFTGSRILQGEIAEFEGLGVYLVDVGVLEPLNIGITEIGLSKQRIPLGGSLYVSATLLPRGQADSKPVVELHLADSEGNLSKRGHQELPLQGDVPQQVQFLPPLTDLTGPVVHGEIRILGGDQLAADDVRRFSVEVGEPPKVLVFAPDRAAANNWLTALNPSENLRFAAEYRPATQLDQSFGNADVIYLINVPDISDEDWRNLGQFVEGGGGLGVFLGHDDIRAGAYNRAAAQVCLPATLDVYQPQNLNLSLVDVNHPLLRKYRDYADGAAIMENDVRIYRFWKVVPNEETTVLMSYTDEDESAALLERVHGKGRVVMFTTAVDARPHPWRWNNFPLPGRYAWTYLAFAEQMTEHLAGSTDIIVNFTAGEDPFIIMHPEPEEREFLLRSPDLTQKPKTLPAGESTLVIGDEDLDELGSYNLFTPGNRQDLLTGFSVNLPAGESDFTRLLEKDLDQLLGKDVYHVARSIEELEVEIQATDIGQEMFPVILVLAIVFFCGEHFVANRFYDPEAEAAAQSAQASAKPA
jgi:hypothetical protein